MREYVHFERAHFGEQQTSSAGLDRQPDIFERVRGFVEIPLGGVLRVGVSDSEFEPDRTLRSEDDGLGSGEESHAHPSGYAEQQYRRQRAENDRGESP